MKKKYTFRKCINDIHLWLGIGSGIILFVVCLTGTILTFEHEIIELADKEKYYVEVPAGEKPLAADLLIAKVEQELGGKAVGAEIPKESNKVYAVSIKKPEEKGRGKTYLINQYTGEIKGSTESSTSSFFTTMMQLHRWLLIEGSAGKIIVGISTIIFTFLIFSGLILWFPKKLRAWKQGFKIKFSANWKRINHDLHNTLGFYSFILLLVMSLTGLCWSFEWYRDGMSAVLGDKVFKQRNEKPLPSNPQLAGTEKAELVSLLQKTEELLPYEGAYRVRFPADSIGSFIISKARSGFLSLTAADKVQFEQYTGAVLKVEKFADKPLNEKIASSIRSLHLGDIFGTFSKILYFISCLIATSLPVTGTIIWINKLKKKSKKKALPALAQLEYYDV